MVSDRKHWQLDKATAFAIAGVITILGLILILLSGHAMTGWSPVWKDLVGYLGKGLLVCASVELVFAVRLVDSVIRRIHEEIASVLPATLVWSESGIERILGKLEVDDVADDITAANVGVSVWVMQSWMFDVEHFLKICQAAAKKSTRKNPLKLILGHPESRHVIERYKESHKDSADDAATRLMSNCFVQNPS